MTKFRDILDEKHNNLLVVDALNLAFRWKHRGESDFKHDYIKTVESLSKSYKASKIILACDYKGSDFRENILPSYKANRKEKFANQTPEEKEKADLFFREFEDTVTLAANNFLVLRYRGIEADDIAALIVSKYLSNFEHTWLISSDKDWDLLVTDKSSRFSYVTRKEISLDNWSTHYDFSPEEYISIKCLMGDSNDNVPGVEGIGPKRAHELIKKYGSALDIVDILPIKNTYKHIQALNASKEELFRNYMLMDLVSFHEDAIGQDNVEDITKKISAYI